MNCQKMGRDSCATAGKAVEILHRWKREPPGINPERGQAPGNRHLARVSGTGGRRVAPGGPGYRLAWRDEPGEAPSISYMEGASPFLPVTVIVPGFLRWQTRRQQSVRTRPQPARTAMPG